MSDKQQDRALEAVVITPAMVQRAACALINADLTEPYDRPDGAWRPGVIAELVLRAALRQPRNYVVDPITSADHVYD